MKINSRFTCGLVANQTYIKMLYCFIVLFPYFRDCMTYMTYISLDMRVTIMAVLADII